MEGIVDFNHLSGKKNLKSYKNLNSRKFENFPNFEWILNNLDKKKVAKVKLTKCFLIKPSIEIEIFENMSKPPFFSSPEIFKNIVVF